MSKSPVTVKILTQWIVGSFTMPCRICGQYMYPEDAIHWDHIHAEVFDGPHVWENLRPTHAVCNQKKGVQEHKDSSKIKRIRGETKQGPKRAIPSRPWPKRGAL